MLIFQYIRLADPVLGVYVNARCATRASTRAQVLKVGCPVARVT